VSKRYGHLLDHWQAAKAEMRAILIDCAREQRTISYSELSARLQTLHLPPYSYAMVGMLDEIGMENFEEGKAPLPTLVVRKSDGRPGPGYFRKSYARYAPVSTAEQVRLGVDQADVETFWQEQFARVCEEWGE
jgi:hypothetical protein